MKWRACIRIKMESSFKVEILGDFERIIQFSDKPKYEDLKKLGI